MAKRKSAPRPAKPLHHKADGLARLRVTPGQLAEVPQIDHLFKPIGGRLKVLEYLAGSEEPEAQLITRMARELIPHQRRDVPFEAYCIAANVTTKKMFGIISQEVMEQSRMAVSLLSKARHVEVVQATIDAALHPLGVQDRRMLHQAEGFVPVPKNNITHIHGNVDARTQTANVAVLPPVEESVRRLSDRFNTGIEVQALPQISDDDGGEDGDQE